MGGKKKAFVLMPFHLSLQHNYKDIYKPALEEAGYEVTRADENMGPVPIMEDIQESILKAKLILCDMSGKNPNVFYELGLAHAVGKPVILVSNKKSDIPFDLRYVRAIVYKSAGEGWENELQKNITKSANATAHRIWPPPLLKRKFFSLVSVLVMLLSCFAVYYLTGAFYQREYPALLERGYKETAKHVKARFEERFMNGGRDDKLNVSYWYRAGGMLYQMTTTEDRLYRGMFTDNKTSIIGCAFAYPNHFVERDNKGQPPVITSYNGDPNPDGSTCRYQAEGRRQIKYIACSSYNGSTNPDANPEYTVAICVFTESDNNILGYNYRGFLKDRTAEFYESVAPLIKDKKLFLR